MRVWLSDWTDFKEEVNLIFGNDDWVATFSTMSGANQEFHRTAVWSGYSIYRLKDSKIIEMMGAEDELSQMKQLGYEIKEPLGEITSRN